MTDALWIVPSYPWSDQPASGIFYQTQARAVTRRDVAVTVACPTPWAPWPLDRARPRWRHYATAPRRARDDAVTVIRPRYAGLPGEPRWARPDRVMAAAVWRARDAWHGSKVIHGHHAVTGLAAWRLAQRTGLPFVLTFHGSDLNTWPERRPDRLPDLRSAVRAAHAVVVVSDALAARLKALTGVDAICLPIGSDHRSLAAGTLDRDVARASLGLIDDRPIVLFVGNLLPAKGIRELVDAVLPRSNLFRTVLVGDGPLRGYGADDPRARGCLDYRGPIAHAGIARYLSAADVLVLPSRSEGLPTVLVEAASLGVPVIATAVGGVPDLLGADRGTLLDDGSAEAIGAALDAFLRERPRAGAAAERLRSYVLAEHDVDENAGRLVEIYGSL